MPARLVTAPSPRHWSAPDPGGPPTAVSGVRCCTRSAAPRRRSLGAPPRCRSPAPDAPIAAARRRSPGAPPLALVRHSAEAGEHEHPETPRQCVTATADGARPPRRGLDAPASSSGPPHGNDLAHGCRPSPPLPVAPLNLARTAPDGVSPVALSLKLCCTPTRRPTVIASSSQRAAASCSECLSSLNAMNVSCSECLSTLPANAAAPAFAATACTSCPRHDCLRSVRPPPPHHLRPPPPRHLRLPHVPPQ